MNTLYTRNSDLEEDDDPKGRDREIALGTSFIIGIFFALILICAVFFAFGYSLGRRSALPASGVPAATPATSTDTGSSSDAKPASGVPASPAAAANSSASSSNTNSADTSDSSNQQAAPAVVPARLAIKPTPVSRTVAPAAVAPGTAQMVVQVAAVSRPADANMLMNALKRHGYDAVIHSSPQDKLLHVQIGPFATKQAADTMRQRLIADGYNAIVK